MTAALLLVIVFGAFIQSPKASPSPATSGWQLKTSTSKMDESKTVVLSRRANESITGWPNRRSVPTLILRCQEGKIDVYVHTGLAAQPELGLHSSVSALVRYDKEPAETIEMSESVGNAALFFPSAIEAIEAMLKAGLVRLRFTPFNWTPQETTFSLRGLERSVGELQRACPEHARPGPRDRIAQAIGDLSNADGDFRRMGAQTLEERAAPGMTAAIEPLTAALHDRDVAVRYRAVRALAKIKGNVSPSAVTDLIRFLTDGEDSGSTAAAEILEGIGPAATDAVPALRLALDGAKSPALAQALRAALAAITREKE